LTERTNIDSVYTSTMLANQRIFNRRLLWLFLLPFVITAILVVMFLILSRRLNDLEVGTRLVTIERYFEADKNYSWTIEQYEKIAANNNSAPILMRLGVLYFQSDKKKNAEIAIQKLEMAKRVDPQYSEIYRSLASIYVSIGRYKDAIEAGGTALKLNPNDAATYNNLAWMYATSKEPAFVNLQLALQYALKAVELTKEQQSDFLDTLAVIYYNLDDRDNALASFRKAKVAILGDLRNLQDDFKKYYPNDSL
jgi:tetratricopeptide (TPR) repeat protein